MKRKSSVLWVAGLSLILFSALFPGAATAGPNEDGLTAAAVRGDLVAVKSYLADGANVNAQNEYGETVLMAASDKGQTEVVKLLLAKGANVNARTKKGDTALIWASGMGRVEVVKLLLAKGADVNVRNNNGQTALSRASARKDDAYLHNNMINIIRLLKEAGAK